MLLSSKAISKLTFSIVLFLYNFLLFCVLLYCCILRIEILFMFFTLYKYVFIIITINEDDVYKNKADLSPKSCSI